MVWYIVWVGVGLPRWALGEKDCSWRASKPHNWHTIARATPIASSCFTRSSQIAKKVGQKLTKSVE